MVVVRVPASQASYCSSRKNLLESHRGQTTARSCAPSPSAEQFPPRPVRVAAGDARTILAAPPPSCSADFLILVQVVYRAALCWPLFRWRHAPNTYLQSMLKLSCKTVSVPSAFIAICMVSCTK
jgi:hypothetical protein